MFSILLAVLSSTLGQSHFHGRVPMTKEGAEPWLSPGGMAVPQVEWVKGREDVAGHCAL